MARRITIDLTDDADDEVERLLSITSLNTTADIFRSALTVLRICVDATREGDRIVLQDKMSFRLDRELQLPFAVLD